jgi:hypothetical protein
MQTWRTGWADVYKFNDNLVVDYCWDFAGPRRGLPYGP